MFSLLKIRRVQTTHAVPGLLFNSARQRFLLLQILQMQGCWNSMFQQKTDATELQSHLFPHHCKWTEYSVSTEGTWWVVAVSQPTLPGSVAVLIRVRVWLDQLQPRGSTAMDQSDLAPAHSSNHIRSTTIDRSTRNTHAHRWVFHTEQKQRKWCIKTNTWNVVISHAVFKAWTALGAQELLDFGGNYSMVQFPLSCSSLTDGASVARSWVDEC